MQHPKVFNFTPLLMVLLISYLKDLVAEQVMLWSTIIEESKYVNFIPDAAVIMAEKGLKQIEPMLWKKKCR